jgi:hypothetical protein
LTRSDGCIGVHAPWYIEQVVCSLVAEDADGAKLSHVIHYLQPTRWWEEGEDRAMARSRGEKEEDEGEGEEGKRMGGIRWRWHWLGIDSLHDVDIVGIVAGSGFEVVLMVLMMAPRCEFCVVGKEEGKHLMSMFLTMRGIRRGEEEGRLVDL